MIPLREATFCRLIISEDTLAVEEIGKLWSAFLCYRAMYVELLYTGIHMS